MNIDVGALSKKTGRSEFELAKTIIQLLVIAHQDDKEFKVILHCDEKDAIKKS